jgi:predicted AlkP superfamily phosphohydrolase/phosphomutase/tetratricopeptide (TPR) repeat protein
MAHKKVLLIGWDAADWEMIDPLLASGQMPALARLLREGLRGNIATLQPVLSPMLWTSIATGKRAIKHGISGFVEPLPDGTGIVPVRSTSRKCKAIWNILTQNGLKSNIVGWFASSPAEPINGVMVTDQFLRAIPAKVSAETFGNQDVYPGSMTETLRDLLVLPQDILGTDLQAFIPRVKEIDPKTDKRVATLARRLAKVGSVQAIATHLMQTEPWDFMAVYYDGIDQFGHEFMPYHPPRMEEVSQRDFELYQDVMRGCYRFHDMMLHALLQYVDADTTVILVSDHGYECGRRRPTLEAGKKDPEGCHRPFGVVAMKGPGLKQNDHLYGASILDVTPTILTLLGLPIGMDMDGRPWLEAFAQPKQPERIFSWEGLGDAEAGLHKDEVRQDPVAAALAIQQLVELGYIAAPGEDARKVVADTIKDQKNNLIRSVLGTLQEAKAIPLLQEFAMERPVHEWVVLNLARCEFNRGNLAETRRTLDLPSATNNLAAPRQLLLAELALAEKNNLLAAEHLHAARAFGGKHPAFLNHVGQVYLDLRRWQDAAEVFSASLAAEPDNAAALGGLARVHLESNQPQAAVEKALQAVGLIHFFPQAHFHLGLGLEQLGRTSEAIAAYETALGIGYQVNALHQRLANLYRPIDFEKSRHHRRLYHKAKRSPVYQAEIKTRLPPHGHDMMPDPASGSTREERA